MFNLIIIEGRLTKDPTLRRTKTGTPVTNITIACEEDFKRKSGEKRTLFLDTMVFGDKAESIAKCFQKGDAIIIQGRLCKAEYPDKMGNERSLNYILADSFDFPIINERRGIEKAGGQPGAVPKYYDPMTPAQPSEPPQFAIDDEKLPF